MAVLVYMVLFLALTGHSSKLLGFFFFFCVYFFYFPTLDVKGLGSSWLIFWDRFTSCFSLLLFFFSLLKWVWFWLIFILSFFIWWMFKWQNFFLHIWPRYCYFSQFLVQNICFWFSFSYIFGGGSFVWTNWSFLFLFLILIFSYRCYILLMQRWVGWSSPSEGTGLCLWSWSWLYPYPSKWCLLPTQHCKKSLWLCCEQLFPKKGSSSRDLWFLRQCHSLSNCP